MRIPGLELSDVRAVLCAAKSAPSRRQVLCKRIGSRARPAPVRIFSNRIKCRVEQQVNNAAVIMAAAELDECSPHPIRHLLALQCAAHHTASATHPERHLDWRR